MCASRLQQDWLAYANQSSRVYIAVERHGPSEFVDNALEDIQILLQCIRIVRRHDAAATELGDVDHHVSNSEAVAGPGALFQAFDSADHNVRAQTAAVEAHVGDGPVGCNQEREHVKPLDAVILEQIRTRFGFSFCCCQRFPEKPKGLVKGRRIPGNDVWIAAVALEHGLQLLTLDVYLR